MDTAVECLPPPPPAVETVREEEDMTVVNEEGTAEHQQPAQHEDADDMDVEQTMENEPPAATTTLSAAASGVQQKPKKPRKPRTPKVNADGTPVPPKPRAKPQPKTPPSVDGAAEGQPQSLYMTPPASTAKKQARKVPAVAEGDATSVGAPPKKRVKKALLAPVTPMTNGSIESMLMTPSVDPPSSPAPSFVVRIDLASSSPVKQDTETAPAIVPSVVVPPVIASPLAFSEPKMYFTSHPETIKELAAFHEYWATTSSNTDMTVAAAVSDYPSAHLPLLAKLAQDNTCGRTDLIQRLLDALFPALIDDSSEPNPASAVLTKDAVGKAIDLVASRVSYGTQTGKTGKGSSIYRWEAHSIDLLPINTRRLVEQRRQRRQLFKDVSENKHPAASLLEQPKPVDVVSSPLLASTVCDAHVLPDVVPAALSEKRKADPSAPTVSEKGEKRQKTSNNTPELPGQSKLSKFFAFSSAAKKDPVQPSAAVPGESVLPLPAEFFKPFFVRPNVELAPLRRVPVKSTADMDSQIESSSSPSMYLSTVRRAKPSQKTPALPTATRVTLKFFKFYDNVRPAYYGTWSKKSRIIRPRMPLALDNDMLQYDVDSDDEWDQEDEAEVGGPVISLTDSEDESEDEDYNANGESSDDDEDEDGIVPDGYLSEDEGDAMECEPKKEKKQKEKSSSKEKSGKRSKLEQIVPTVIQPNFQKFDAATGVFAPSSSDLHLYAAVSLAGVQLGIQLPSESSPLRSSYSSNSGETKDEKHSSNGQARTVPTDALPLLVKLVHKSIKLEGALAQFQAAHPNVSKRQLELKVKEMFVKEKRPDALRELWYVKPAFAHILALIPPSVVAPTPELSISTEENSETMPVAQPVAPAKSIKTIFQRASEKKMEDDRLTRSFDGDDEQQMDCSLDGPSPSQRAQELHDHVLCHVSASEAVTNEWAKKSSLQANVSCCTAAFETFAKAGKRALPFASELAIRHVLETALDAYQDSSLRTIAYRIVNAYMTYFAQSKAERAKLDSLFYQRPRLLKAIGRTIESILSTSELVAAAIKFAVRLVIVRSSVFDRSSSSRFGVEAANAVWDLVLPLINEKGRYSDDVPIAAAVCITNLIPFADLASPAVFWKVGHVLSEPLKSGPSVSYRLRLFCLRGLKALVMPEYALSPPRLDVCNFMPLVALLAALLNAAIESEPARVTTDVRRDFEQSQAAASEILARYMSTSSHWISLCKLTPSVEMNDFADMYNTALSTSVVLSNAQRL